MKKELKHSLWMAWLVWGLAALYYFSDYMARVAPGVMHQSLQSAFAISESGFGLLTYSFYIPYILMQIPVGLLVDRLSIRRLLTAMSVLTALGCILFGMSDSLLMAALGRMLIGFSAAFAFISSLRIATAWFPPAMLGLLAGLTQALGMLGAAAGEAPIAWLAQTLGWRDSMYCLGGLFLILAVFLYYFIQDHESMARVKQNKKYALSILESLKIILSHKQIWVNALYAGCLFGPTAVIGESYGPAFLQYGWNLSAHQAASAIGFIFIGWGVGGPLLGWISDSVGKRKPFMILSALCTFVMTIVMIYFPLKQAGMAYVLFFVFGLTNSGVGLAYALSTELSSRAVVGSAIAFTNMASIFVGASLQPLVGRMIDKVAGVRSFHVDSLSLSDFQQPLALLVLCSGVALGLAFMVKETYCRNIVES
jgi:sugar phosphate permease